MDEIIRQIRTEITRTEELIRNHHNVIGFTTDILHVEMKEDVFKKLYADNHDTNRYYTLFGFNCEVNENLTHDFAIYVDSFYLS